MKKTGVIGMVVAVAVIIIGLGMWLFSGSGSTCYTQIDNSRITEGKPRDGVIDLQGGMRYSYTLMAYNEKGAGKEISFGASRELREGAFLKLTVSPVRGVVEWNEVEYEELPEGVKKRYEVREMLADDINEELVQGLTNIFQTNISMIILYGSAARG